ncbi:MAG TPA: hypothetical protein PLX41_12465 [Bacteroidales bacterium]|nr:hypothetical protein [Bacteroidales bacterium]
MGQSKKEYYPELTTEELFMKLIDEERGEEAIISITEVVRTLFTGIAAEYVTGLNIPTSQRVLLMHYLSAGKLYNDSTLPELAATLGISRNTLHTAAQGLEAQGLIKRTDHGAGKVTDLTPILTKILRYKRAYSLTEDKLIKMLDGYKYIQYKQEDRPMSDRIEVLTDFLLTMFNRDGYSGHDDKESHRLARDFRARNFLRFCLLRGFDPRKLTHTLIHNYLEIILSTNEDYEKLVMGIILTKAKKWKDGIKAYEQQTIFIDKTILTRTLVDIDSLNWLRKASDIAYIRNRLADEDTLFFERASLTYGITFTSAGKFDRVSELGSLLWETEQNLDEVFRRFLRELSLERQK